MPADRRGRPAGYDENRHASMANARNRVHLSPERASHVVPPIVGGSSVASRGRLRYRRLHDKTARGSTSR